MWSEEVVEVFIDPDGDGRDYLEFQVNPLNAHVDLHIISLNPWDSSIEWDIDGVRNAVDVIGTVNDSSDTDRHSLAGLSAADHRGREAAGR